MLDVSNGIRGIGGIVSHAHPATCILLWKAGQGKERASANYLLVGGAPRQRPQQH